MTKPHKSPQELAAANTRIFLKYGPGLRRDYSVWIVARDTSRTPPLVLLGGLGGMGCGTMWTEEEAKHKEYSGYDEAPQMDSTDGVGTPENLERMRKFMAEITSTYLK